MVVPGERGEGRGRRVGGNYMSMRPGCRGERALSRGRAIRYSSACSTDRMALQGGLA